MKLFFALNRWLDKHISHPIDKAYLFLRKRLIPRASFVRPYDDNDKSIRHYGKQVW